MNKRAIASAFLLIELVLYLLILTTSGTLLVISSYISIAFCFIYALTNLSKNNALTVAALACTLVADTFLVLISPAHRLTGMVFFLAAQILYAAKLNRLTQNNKILCVRVIMTVASVSAVFIILEDKADALAVVSIAYYANLIFNAIEAFTRFKKDGLFPIALVLFILCDTVIGLQTATGVYLPIAEGSLLYEIIFMDFFLSWFFYLPSQVLIALGTYRE